MLPNNVYHVFSFLVSSGVVKVTVGILDIVMVYLGFLYCLPLGFIVVRNVSYLS